MSLSIKVKQDIKDLKNRIAECRERIADYENEIKRHQRAINNLSCVLIPRKMFKIAVYGHYGKVETYCYNDRTEEFTKDGVVINSQEYKEARDLYLQSHYVEIIEKMVPI
jgi:hypothetical protein